MRFNTTLLSVPLLVVVPILGFTCWAEKSEQDVERMTVYGKKLEIPINHTRLRREDFLQRGSTLADILQNESGLQVRRSGGKGNPVKVSIRGSSHQQVQFYIDGQLANDSQFGGFDLEQLPLEQIETIEISKGQALDTGSTPIGGVIKINTFNPNKDHSKFSAGYGSFESRELHGLYSTGSEKLRTSISVDWLKASNNYDYWVKQPLDHPQHGEEQKLRNNGFEKLSLYLNQNILLGMHQIRLSYQLNQQEKEIANYQSNSAKNESRLDTDSHRLSTFYSWKTDFNYLDAINLDSYWEVKNESYFNRPEPSKNERSDYESEKFNIKLDGLFKFSDFSLLPYIKFGTSEFESNSHHSKAGNHCNGVISCDVIASLKSIDLGSRFEWLPTQSPWSGHLLTNKLWHETNNEIIQPYLPGGDTQLEQVVNKDKSYFTHDAALNYLFPKEKLKVSLLLGKGVRTPTLYEMYGDRGLLKGNLNLRPELSNSISLAVQQTKKNYNWRLSLYQNNLEDAIVTIYNSRGEGVAKNIGGADVKGVELYARYSVSNKLSITASGNWIDSKQNSEYKAFNRKKLPGIYHYQHRLSLDYKLSEKLSLLTQFNHESELYHSRTNLVDKEGSQDKITLDSALYFSNADYKVRLSIENIFNETYRDIYYRPAVGRSFNLKITLGNL